MTGASIKSGVAADLATVDATPKSLRHTLYGSGGVAVSVPALSAKVSTQGGIPAMMKGGEALRIVACDNFGNPLGLHVNPLLWEEWSGTSPIAVWTATSASMSADFLKSAYLIINSTFAVTVSGLYSLFSRGQYFILPESPLHFRVRARSSLAVGQWAYIGLTTGPPGGSAVSPDCAVAFEWGPGGTVTPMLSFQAGFSNVAGTRITGTDFGSTLLPGYFYNFEILAGDDRATFICTESGTGKVVSEQTLRLGLAQQRMLSAARLGVHLMVRNSSASAPPNGGFFAVGALSLSRYNAVTNRPWGHVIAPRALSSILNPIAHTQTANYANSAAPASATLSNTVPGYATLGGQFQWVPVAGAETDYCLFAFSPVAPHSLNVTGVHIELFAAGTIAPTAEILTQWGLGVNGATANLATGAYLRKSLGRANIPTSSPLGTASPQIIDVEFPEPLVTTAGRIFAIIMKCPVSSVMASTLVRGVCDVRGYFD